jgi:hypothetical protein
MKLGLIADEFTRVCLELEPGLEVVNLTPRHCFFDIAFKNIDVILIESAWLGFSGKWKGKIALYEKNETRNKLNHIALLSKIARIKKIPIVFWNKEDPVCFERFKHQVEYADVCLTTDINKLAAYKQLLKPKQKVDVQSFFFQPALHNPKVEAIDNNLSDKAVFCGGYYLQEYPDRAERLDAAIESIGENNFVVYDRFESGRSSWQGYHQANGLDIKLAFNYIESKYYYQQGMAHLNVNSLDGLSTMFSRRMLELIACNQKVIDLTHYKKKSLLSEFVIQASNSREIKQALWQEKPNIDFQYLKNEFSVNTFLNKLKAII